MKELILTMEQFKESIRYKKTIVFGAGEYCMRFLNRLSEEDVKYISCVIDNDKEKQGGSIFGIPVCVPDELAHMKPEDTIVVIAIENNIPQLYDQVLEYGEFTIAAVRILINDILSQVAKELYDGKEQIEKVRELLYDDRSKWIYDETIKRRLLYGECDFSDLIVRGDAEYRVPIVYSKHKPKDEIIIDCGAYNGDTLKKFVETYGYSLKKIYAFECMEESIEQLENTMSQVNNRAYAPEMVLMPYALGDRDCTMKFAKTNKPNGSFLVDNRAFAQKALWESEYVEVPVTSLDKVIPKDEKITFIKMDIEGSEYATLHGAEKIITTHKPILAVSIYHSGEDYYRLALYLKELVPEYKFAVRHHNKNHCDTDLYCWVEE